MRALLTLLVLGAGSASATDCPPAAQVEGDEPIATTIRTELSRRGIGASADVTCPAVYAVIRGSEGRVHAVVRDEAGRERSYELEDPATAATIVESWARHEEGALPPGPPARAAVPAPHAAVAPSRRPISMAVLAGTGHGSEGSIWSDASLAACAQFGSVCAGALARASRDSGEYGDADRYDTKRDAVDLLGTVHAMRHIGRWGWGGGLGFGFGWQHSQTERNLSGGDDAESFGGLRLEARAIASAALARELQLELSFAAGLSPLAHQDAIRDGGAIVAAEPRAWLRTGLGLRFGGP